MHRNGVVDGVRDDKIEVHGGGDFVEHFKHGIKHVVDVNVQHLDENIAFVEEISIDDARGNARFFCDFRRVRVEIAGLCEKFVPGVDNSVLFVDRALLLRLAYFL